MSPYSLFGNTFVDLRIEGEIDVRIMNPSAEDILLRAAIGYLREVDDFIEFCSNESSGTVAVSQVRPTIT